MSNYGSEEKVLFVCAPFKNERFAFSKYFVPEFEEFLECRRAVFLVCRVPVAEFVAGVTGKNRVCQ
jgi:hypothetical protein